MANGRQLSVNEMKRILKPSGRVYINVGGPPFGYVDKKEWESILEGFRVERGGSWLEKWSLVSLREDL
jgi:hypothetical protein